MVKPYAPALITASKSPRLGRAMSRSLAKKSPLSQIGPTTSALIGFAALRSTTGRIA